MKSGLCPKCSSKRIIRHNSGPGSIKACYDGEFYTCADCAYSEWYPEADEVAKLAYIASGGPGEYIRASWVNPPDQSPYR